jgi:hypothetical protein
MRWFALSLLFTSACGGQTGTDSGSTGGTSTGGASSGGSDE